MTHTRTSAGELAALELRFTDAVRDDIRTCLTLSYNPRVFTQMVAMHGARTAAQQLLQPPAAYTTDGFQTLWRKGRLDLTVEALVLRPQWYPLFTPQEREIARERLRLHNYWAPWDSLGGHTDSRCRQS